MAKAERTGKAELLIPQIIGKQGLLISTLYVAAGNTKRPVIIFAHGYPGHEKNTDLAQSLRDQGFHVLQFSYSGSWGSNGTFSFENCFDDINSVLEYVLNNELDLFDTKQIFILGHSAGAIFAANAVAARPEIKGCILLMPYDVGNMYTSGKFSLILENFQEGIPYLNTANAGSLFRELKDNPQLFSLCSYAESLSQKAVLCLSGKIDKMTPEDIHVRPLLKAMKKYPDADFTYKSFDTDHYFSNMRGVLTREIDAFINQHIEHMRASVNHSSFVEEIQELIEERYRKITLADLSEYFNLSIPYVSELIHKQTGRNFKELVLEEKMKHAIELLTGSDLSINDIADYLEYDNPAYFMRVFKKYTGFTPTGYRNQHREKKNQTDT